MGNSKQSYAIIFGLSMLAAIGGCSLARAADMPVKATPSPPVRVYDPWKIDVTLYGWLPSLNGTSIVKGHTTDVDFNFFSDIGNEAI